MEGIREKTTSISYPKIRLFNGIMGGLHLIQAVVMLVTGLVITSINDTKLPITTYYRYYDDVLGTLVKDPPVTIANLPIGPIVSAFLFMSAIAHFLLILPGLNKFYNKNLEKGINYFRWFEYALSSSVMITIIAMLFGVTDLSTLILIFCINATMNLCGLIMEVHNQTTDKTNWLSFIVGTFAGLIPWIILMLYLLNTPGVANAPWWAWSILGGYIFFFWTFPLNLILQYGKVGKWENYIFGEYVYIFLSLTSKTLLAWLTFAGTFQP